MRNAGFAPLAFRQTAFHFLQQKQFIHDLVERKCFRHFLNCFQN